MNFFNKKPAAEPPTGKGVKPPAPAPNRAGEGGKGWTAPTGFGGSSGFGSSPSVEDTSHDRTAGGSDRSSWGYGSSHESSSSSAAPHDYGVHGNAAWNGGGVWENDGWNGARERSKEW